MPGPEHEPAAGAPGPSEPTTAAPTNAGAGDENANGAGANGNKPAQGVAPGPNGTSKVSLPGEIDSLGVVPGWVVRDLVTDVITTPGTGFRAVIYDDETGELKGMSSIRFVPPKAMA